MLVNAHLSWRRRWTTERRVGRADAAGGLVGDRADAVVARQQMRAVLAGLAPRARTVLVLRYYADFDDAAIAEAMGVSPSSVRATASRALASLREAAGLEGRDGDPMTTPTEQLLRELFAADAAAAPRDVDLTAGVLRKVRRRRVQTVGVAGLVAAVATIGAVVATGVAGRHPQRPPVATSPQPAGQAGPCPALAARPLRRVKGPCAVLPPPAACRPSRRRRWPGAPSRSTAPSSRSVPRSATGRPRRWPGSRWPGRRCRWPA